MQKSREEEKGGKPSWNYSLLRRPSSLPLVRSGRWSGGLGLGCFCRGRRRLLGGRRSGLFGRCCRLFLLATFRISLGFRRRLCFLCRRSLSAPLSRGWSRLLLLLLLRGGGGLLQFPPPRLKLCRRRPLLLLRLLLFRLLLWLLADGRRGCCGLGVQRRSPSGAPRRPWWGRRRFGYWSLSGPTSLGRGLFLSCNNNVKEYTYTMNET